MVQSMKFINQNKIMNKFIFNCLVLIFGILFTLPVLSQKKKVEVIRDTIWIMDGKEYTVNPLKKRSPKVTPGPEIKYTDLNKLSPTETHDYFRYLVDSLGRLDTQEFNRDSLAAQIIKLVPIYNKWCTDCLFQTSNKNEMTNNIEFELVKNNEIYYFNKWGSFNWGYGPRWGRMHRGIDLSLTTGDTIFSSFNGIVRYAKFNDGGYGNCVIVRHFNGIETLYAHMSEIIVQPGQLVYTKEPLGLGGSTGRSTGPHLHFETRYQGHSFDPLKIFNKDTYTLNSDTLKLTLTDITDPPIPKSKSSKVYHMVKSGQTLSQIARQHKTTIAKIQKLNNIKNPNLLRVGQKLRVK